jgi:hypothetical protein
MMKIERAQKKKQKLKIALAGASGSGKTFSALKLAFSMCQKVCVIDTERGSASLYSDKFPEYDILELDAPYSPDRYIEAIKAAEENGYDCIIIDSLSHEWNGQGGCLDMVENVTRSSYSKNSYTAWATVTPKHQKLIQHILDSKAHMIVTMRSKTQYELTANDKGKMTPTKIGMAPTQRDGIEYEFTLVFDLDQNHNFTCSKDRTSLFVNTDIPSPLNEEVGKKIMTWLESGVEPAQVSASQSTILSEDEEFKIKARTLFQIAKKGDISKKDASTKWRSLLDEYPLTQVDLKMQTAFDDLLFKAPPDQPQFGDMV